MSMMDRRFFIDLVSSGVIGYSLDIDKLLWVPGKKKIFIPSVKQLQFYNEIADRDNIMHGIPYHYYSGSSDMWLGIKRKK